jgi:hypothetical protein
MSNEITLVCRYMFNSRLAHFLYEKVKSLIVGRDTNLVLQVIDSLRAIPKDKIGIFLAEVDDHLVRRLAGDSLLKLAQAINLLDPTYIATYMPVLLSQTRHLTRAKEVADLFQEEALDRLIDALKAERGALEA